MRRAAPTFAAALVLVGVAAVVLSTRSHPYDMLAQYVPHVGPLTMMVEAQKAAALKAGGMEGEEPARTQQLAWFRDEADASHSARQWAQRELRTGLARSESASRTSLTSAKSFAPSLSTRSYHNDHSGYTSSVPESRADPDDGAYAFAKRITNHRDDRRDAFKAPTQELSEEAGREARGRGRHLPTSISTRRYRNNHPGYTTDIAESREGADDGAWDFASRLQRASHAHRRDTAVESRRRRQALASSSPASGRLQQLDLVDDSHAQDMQEQAQTAWEWANDNAAAADDAESGRTEALQRSAPSSSARGQRPSGDDGKQYASPSWEGEKSVYRPGREVPSGFTSAISEARAPADEAAWGWASDLLNKDGSRPRVHRSGRIVRHHDSEPEADAGADKEDKVEEKEPEMDSVESRAAMEAAARKELALLHKTTAEAESAHISQALDLAQRRMQEIAEKDREQQDAADAGANDELSQYGAAASLGVPEGAGTSESVMSKIKDWSTGETSASKGERKDMKKASEEAQHAALNLGHSPERVQGDNHQSGAVALGEQEEAEVYHEGFEAGLKEAARDEKQARDEAVANEAKANAKKIAALRASKAKRGALKIARTQDLAEQHTWDDAWGPSSGDWA